MKVGYFLTSPPSGTQPPRPPSGVKVPKEQHRRFCVCVLPGNMSWCVQWGQKGCEAEETHHCSHSCSASDYLGWGLYGDTHMDIIFGHTLRRHTHRSSTVLQFLWRRMYARVHTVPGWSDLKQWYIDARRPRRGRVWNRKPREHLFDRSSHPSCQIKLYNL